MPKESLSVYLTAVDRMSPVLNTLADKTRALDKANEDLQQTYKAMQDANQSLIDQRTELRASLEEQKIKVAELRAEYKAYSTDMNGLRMQLAIEEQDALNDKLKEVEDQLRRNRKTYNENREEIRKGLVEDPGTGLGGESSVTDMSAIWGGLGIGEQLSSLTQSAFGALVSSAYGSEIGSMASGTLSSAITGASLGTAIAPGIGTAIGAAFGGLSGLYSGAIEQWANKDEAFKAYYSGLYDDVKDRSGEMVESGTSLASTRETNRISFKTLFGSERAANEYLEDLIDMANVTPFLYDDLVSMSKTLATYGYDESNILPLLQTIGDAGAALGMGTSDMNSVGQALGRMKSSDKATLEYLNILNDRGIGAVGMLAEAKGVSQGQMYDMISKGSISGSEAVEIITAALEKAYAGSMEEQSQTFSGLSSTLEGLQQNLDALGGEGYNTLRQEGVREEVNALGGDLGDAIGEINRVMGENQARKENMQEQYLREALEAVLLGQEGSVFSEAQNAELAELSARYAEMKARYDKSDGTDSEAGAKMEALYEEAQVLGQAYFDNSDFVKMLNDTELDEITAIQEATAGLHEATQASYKLSQVMSKGFASISSTISSSDVDYSTMTYADDGGNLIVNGAGRDDDWMFDVKPSSHAFGLDRVPYDDYPALLHEGERVLTAAQARAQDAGQGGAAPLTVSITGNYFTGAPEEMADQLAEIILRKLTQAAIAAAPK